MIQAESQHAAWWLQESPRDEDYMPFWNLYWVPPTPCDPYLFVGCVCIARGLEQREQFRTMVLHTNYLPNRPRLPS